MGMTPVQAISAATINDAHALACAETVGSLELGKSADLPILNISDYQEPAHHFGMNLVGTNLVDTTIKRGEIIWKEGKVAPRPVQNLRPWW
jgi:imidazolonepropionase